MIRSRLLLAYVALAPVFKLAIPRHRPELIRAIEQSRSPVTAGDVAIATGMNLVLVEQALLALAVDVGGHLRVAGDGVVAYVFPRNIQVVLASRYGWLRVQKLLRNGWKLVLYILRISFGIIPQHLGRNPAVASGFLNRTTSEAPWLSRASPHREAVGGYRGVKAVDCFFCSSILTPPYRGMVHRPKEVLTSAGEYLFGAPSKRGNPFPGRG